MTEFMDTRQLIYSYNSSIRQSFKNIQDWRRGYSKHFADFKRSPDTYGFRSLWGECVTPIKSRRSSDDAHFNRCRNMQLVIDYVSGIVLNPGQVFSFWDQTPKPTAKNGFRVGPMLERGQLKYRSGGGLCQISTALFGAFLRANCEILEHHNHSADAHGEERFFTLGQDATVVYGYKDLMARNPTSVPLQVRIKLNRSFTTLTASVWGVKPPTERVRLTSDVLESLPTASSNGLPGWRVETKRWVMPIDAASDGVGLDVVELDGAVLDLEDESWKINYEFISRYQPFNPVTS